MANVLSRAVHPSRSVFYPGIVAALIGVIFAGFLPRYFMRIDSGEPLPAFVHAHAAVFTLWLFVLLAQTLLIRADRVDLHRRLGIAAALLVLPMLGLGYETAIFGARRGHPFATGEGGGPIIDPLAFLIVPLSDLVLFAGFVGAALWYRRSPETHKRLMVFAAIGGFAWPAITRIPFVAGEPVKMFGVLALLVLAQPVYDLVSRRGRVHAATVVGVLVVAASFPLRRVIVASPGWREVAVWLTG